VSIRGFGLAVDLFSVKPLEDYASTSEMLKAIVVGEFFECLRRLSTLPFGAVFMFVEESVGKEDSGRHSRPDRVRLGAAECAAPHGLRNKAFIYSDRSLIDALHVRDEYHAAVRRRIYRTNVAADRLLSPVMSYHKSILNLYSGVGWSGVPRRSGGERRSPPSH
jgi:hypothetical protein